MRERALHQLGERALRLSCEERALLSLNERILHPLGEEGVWEEREREGLVLCRRAHSLYACASHDSDRSQIAVRHFVCVAVALAWRLWLLLGEEAAHEVCEAAGGQSAEHHVDDDDDDDDVSIVDWC